MASRVVLFLIGLAALAATVISFNLTMKHIRGTSGMAWFEAGCSEESGPGKMNCAKVLNSPYSYFPPKKADQPGGPHTPVSFLGLIYYSALFIWTVAIGRPTPDRRRVHLIPLAFIGIGLAFSAWFVYIMSKIITEWCPWCLVTHGLNLLIAIGFIMLWPRRRAVTVTRAEAVSEATPLAPIFVSHPTNRLLLTTVLAILFVSYGHLFAFEWVDLAKEQGRFKAEIEALRSNVGAFIAQWQIAPVCSISARPDDPVKVFSKGSTPAALLEVTIFSDFECPACARFAEFFDSRIVKLFDHRVRVTFRHYPLDQACNPRSTTTMHKFACASSYLAEGARVLGGNEAFWKAHDFLFQHRDDIAAGTMTAQRLAKAAGLDASNLQSAANPDDIKPRIVQDVEQGVACGIRGTPSVFVEGRKVESIAAGNIEFWDKLADWFWLEKVKKERPTTTRLAKPATPQTAPSPQG